MSIEITDKRLIAGLRNRANGYLRMFGGEERADVVLDAALPMLQEAVIRECIRVVGNMPFGAHRLEKHFNLEYQGFLDENGEYRRGRE